ncbi:MAG: type II toxin-antitoxin system PemK/MazF family toxin [Planctomycetes bacterium]|nr:type II toxin-antitoxin system PemK/MazF family toxin [Planctomycetota bacterium]
MSPDRGDLVLLPFPFTDLSTQKRRPAVVVSPDRLHAVTEDRVVVAVTSNLTARLPGGAIPLSSRDLVRGRLPAPSLILPGKVFTLHRTLVVKVLGRLRPDTLESLLSALRALFAHP